MIGSFRIRLCVCVGSTLIVTIINEPVIVISDSDAISEIYAPWMIVINTETTAVHGRKSCCEKRLIADELTCRFISLSNNYNNNNNLSIVKMMNNNNKFNQFQIPERWKSKMMCPQYSTRESPGFRRVTPCWRQTTGPTVPSRMYCPEANPVCVVYKLYWIFKDIIFFNSLLKPKSIK